MQKKKRLTKTNSMRPTNSAQEHLKSKRNVGERLVAFLKRQGYLKKKNDLP